MTEDEMVGWHHRLYGYEFEQAPRVGDGQGSLACFSPRHHKEEGTINQVNNDERERESHFTGSSEWGYY